MSRSVFRTKAVADLAPDGHWGLRRSLGTRTLALLGISATYGVGAFVVLGEIAARYAGPAALLSIALAGLVALLVALCYAEFAAMTPVAGSSYSYAYATLGELPAAVLGWVQLLGSVAGTAVLAAGWSGYFVSALHRIGVHLPASLSVPAAGANVPAAAVVLLVTAILAAGIRESPRAFAPLMLLRVFLPLLVFVLPALWLAEWAGLTPFLPQNAGAFGAYGASGVWVGAGVAFFLFQGMEAVSTSAEETRTPQRDLPLALALSMAVTTVLYLLLTLALVGLAGYQRVGVANPFSVALDAKGTGRVAAVAVELILAVLITSGIMIFQLGLQRSTYAVARDGLLPSAFTRIHPRYRTPFVAVVAGGGASAVAAGLLPLGTAVRVASLAVLVDFAVVCTGVMVLRRSAPERPRPFRLPWAGVLAPAAAAGCVALAAALVACGPVDGVIMAAWIALGLLTYAAYGYRRSRVGMAAGAEEAGAEL